MASPDLQSDCLKFLQKDGWPNRFVGYNEVFGDSRYGGAGV